MNFTPISRRPLLGFLSALTAATGAATGATPPQQQIVYRDIIAPILEQKCYSCHGADKQKGKFRLDDYESLVKGGKESEGLIHGKSAESNIVVRIDLPKDDDEHMPPEEKKQLEPHEVMLIKWWIDSGASKDAKLADLKSNVDVEAALTMIETPEARAKQRVDAEQKASSNASQRAALKADVDRLRKEFPAALNFESQSTSGVVFTAVSMRKDFGDDDLAKLAPVIPALVSLDLSSSSVTDKGVALLKAATELRSLRLSESGITDAGLEVVGALPKLESLNLYGTQVTNFGLGKLQKLHQLKRLYLWKTKVEPRAVQALKARLPGCQIEMGM